MGSIEIWLWSIVGVGIFTFISSILVYIRVRKLKNLEPNEQIKK